MPAPPPPPHADTSAATETTTASSECAISSEIRRSAACSIVSARSAGQATRIRPGRMRSGCQPPGILPRHAATDALRSSSASPGLLGACGGGGSPATADGPRSSPTPPSRRPRRCWSGRCARASACQLPRAATTTPASPEAGLQALRGPARPGRRPLWVTVDGMVLYKSRERAEDCFYVDLAPGEHQVDAARRGDGRPVGARWRSPSRRRRGRDLVVRHLRLRVRHARACATLDELDELEGASRQAQARQARPVRLDQGARASRWDTGRMPDQRPPERARARSSPSTSTSSRPTSPPGSSDVRQAGDGAASRRRAE